MRDRLVIVSLLLLLSGYMPQPKPRPTKTTPTPPPRPFTLDDQTHAIQWRLTMTWLVPWNVPAAWRRARLFALWSDADFEPFTSEARAQVEYYIHEHLPAAGRDAFTDEEITRFNLQRGRPPDFDPYGTWSARHPSPP